ncbi:3 beta-hydroxysteroid dehydrogenase/delta 5--_4-isomerase [mine drainage metagenome]|uniref:3 beta-hydroxysteroid dehydrogenase/delta 5-->4-isomerase n=1 Tax=mine drainage metagenome TaxID=410659 RepID=A0A1J5T2R0_9ZZZZ
MSEHPTPGMNDPVLVTGGTGFLGKRLVLRLRAQGRRVIVLARHVSPELEAAGVRCVTGSIEDAAAVDRAVQGAATVFHVAAKVGVWGPNEAFFRANVLGTRTVIDACRRHGVRRLVHTSTPSVVYNGLDLAGADETLPLTTACPCAYPATKAQAEREVLAANGADLGTVALRPHLIWGRGDPHLVPRILARARAGRLRIVGSGRNRVDMVHVDNAVDAHLLAEQALAAAPSAAAGRAYFITNGEPIVLWEWINSLLAALGEKPITRRISLGLAQAAGAACEGAWSALRLRGEPPLTRFVASELARDHWFSIAAARRDLGYEPRISMEAGTRDLIASLTEV